MKYLGIFVFGLFVALVCCNSANSNRKLYAGRYLLIQDTCPDDIIKFELYTKKNPNVAQILPPNKDEILKSNYNPEHENKIIFHGWQGNASDPRYQKLKDVYLNHTDLNVWMVDWSHYAADIIYPNVLPNMDHVGKCTAQMINAILEISTVPKNAFHLLGHSLGAHVAGYVGVHLKPYLVARITALDAAMPLMDTTGTRSLAKGDARFVDAIHTNAGFAGKLNPFGDVDFYPNGGMAQPGCPLGPSSNPEDDLLGCHHHRSVAYFMESIVSDVGFYGWFCKDYQQYLDNKCPAQEPEAIMGEYIKEKNTGVYIVPTRAREPFAAGSLFQLKTKFTPIPLQQSIPFNVSDLADYLNKNVVQEPFNTLELEFVRYKKLSRSSAQKASQCNIY